MMIYPVPPGHIPRYLSAITSWRRVSNTTAKGYDAKTIERKWQEKWKRETKWDYRITGEGDKRYILSMFPYPSGALHMGHVRVYTISDCLARYHRMCGKKVLHPIGWDSFGLPAENAAIDRGVNPKDWTNQNIQQMKQQLLNLGLQFDWSQELSTCQPSYYKWTQWLFLQLLKHNLVYRKEAVVNWDPVDNTVLANEQVDDKGFAWRSGAKVEQRLLSQWFVKITDYAERLLDGLEKLDWPVNVKRAQQNWIGRSQGCYFDFKLQGHHDNHNIRVFTTRPETIFGVTFVALSTEHPLLYQLDIDQDVRDRVATLNNTEGKRGVYLNQSVLHPLTGESVPVYVTNYVLNDYGSEAIMGVPAHDDRDAQFVASTNGTLGSVEVLTSEGSVLVNSGKFSGMECTAAVKGIMDTVKAAGVGGHMTQYRLRDWLISRQRYWGAPIPVMHCDKCGIVPVPESALPVTLPDSIQVTRGSIGSLRDTQWTSQTTCGKEGCRAMRETDTMDTFVDSSWYFVRYLDARNDKEMVSGPLAKQWLPVDVYIGGIEHANLHLLYARFISHFLYDIGLLAQPEPFSKLISQGMVLGKTHYLNSTGQYIRNEDTHKYTPDEMRMRWEKMSKSKYNGVDPDSCVDEYGADVVRVYTLFKAPPEQDMQWDTKAIKGVYLWLIRVWKLTAKHIDSTSCTGNEPCTDIAVDKLNKATEKAITQVSSSFSDKYKLNVAIPHLMTFSNTLKGVSSNLVGTSHYHTALTTLCRLMAPFAPHFAAEMWEELRVASNNLNIHHDKNDIHSQRWPETKQSSSNETTIAVMVNNKYRQTLTVPSNTATDQIKELVLAAVTDKNITRAIVTSNGRAVNILTDE